MDPEAIARHAQIFANRMKKNHHKLTKTFKHKKINTFHLYN